MRKSQMELMGIAIVVLIVSLIFLFVIRFILMGSLQNTADQYPQSMLAESFITTIINVDAKDCLGTKFSTLFDDCYKLSRLSMSAQDGIKCPSPGAELDSCEYLNEKLRYILQQTFDKWKVKYKFAVVQDPKRLNQTVVQNLFINEDQCMSNYRRSCQTFSLIEGGSYNICLFLC